MAGNDALEALASSHSGLSWAEARSRLARDGPNLLAQARGQSLVGRIAAQVSDAMILLLLAAALLAIAIGEPGDAAAILAIVVLNAAIGVTQEHRAERALKALQELAAPCAHAIRAGEATLIPAAELVSGDLVRVEAGTMVPADLRLLECVRLRIDEATLTGESVPVDKVGAPIAEADVAIGDRRNMAYRGTLVTYGRGLGLAVATGMSTELGRVASLLGKTAEPPTPLQRRLAQLGRRLAAAAVIVCAIVLVSGLLRGEPPLRMLLTAISLAVAAIPEALPAVVTLALALGARRMAAHKALVRKLPAVEALGSVTVICADKTGTLTQNRMRAEALYCDGELRPDAGAGSCWADLLTAMALCTDVEEGREGALVGDPTEVALAQAAREAGSDRARLLAIHPRLGEVPFDAERRMMTTFHTDGRGEVVSYSKGAAEEVLARTVSVAGSAGRRSTTLDVQETAEALAAEGFRVLALAERRWPALPANLDPQQVEAGLTLLGLVGMIDPPRAEARLAIETCRAAGIVPVMITGDHPLTARAVARRLGLPAGRDDVLAGTEVDALDEGELAARAGHVRVYARVTPEQKLRIVRALQARGEVVAMTGDGVNDAPALRSADIGVAMGRGGTDAAREAAAMVLLDDNFATIVHAIGEGRRIYGNARRFVRYITATNAAEVLTIFLAPLLGMPLPLLPLQILWINLVTDSAPALALALEPAEPGLMRQPPRPAREGIFARGMGFQVAWAAGLMALVTLAVQGWALGTGRASWQTMVFTVLCLSQLANALAVRSESASLWKLGLFSNRPLLAAVAVVASLQMAVVYAPPLASLFGTVPLTAAELALTLAASAVILVAIEMEKLMRRRRGRTAPRGATR